MKHTFYRGRKSGKVDAFRSCYDRLSELRSLPQKHVPMMALTATATSSTVKYIISSLCLFAPTMLCASPERTNIKYHIQHVNKYSIKNIFSTFKDDIHENGYSAKKVLIFCRKMVDLRNIFEYFIEEFPSYKYTDRPFAMYHSRTKEDIKNYILQDFVSENSKIRILISTIAFGMGVDCKGLNLIIHFGPPCSLEDYFQESGRGGRDGSQVDAIIITYPRCLASKNITKSMKYYCKNNVQCRRQILLAEFEVSFSLRIEPLHLCCDICAKYCRCNNTTCGFSTFPFIIMEEHIESTSKSSFVIPEIIKQKLRNTLVELRNEHIAHFEFSHSGIDSISGFPLKGIEDVMAVASPNLTVDQLKRNTCIFNSTVMDNIVEVVFNILRDCPFSSLEDFDPNVSGANVSSSDEETSDESDNDFQSLLASYHVRLSDSDS